VPTLAAPRPLTRRAAPVAGGAAAAVVLALIGAAVAVGIGTADVPLWITLAGGIGLIAALALAVLRYETACFIGLLLLGIVRIEPAPVDGMFAVIIAVALVTGRIDLRAAPLWVSGAVAAFVALNLLSCLEAVDAGRAAFFMSITVYCVLLGLWTASFTRSERRARLVLVAYVGVAVVSAVASTLALYVTFPGSEALTAFEVTRARGLFKDPNVYGPFLVVAAVLLLMEVLEPRLLRVRASLKLVMLGALFVGVFTAYSRAGWLNMVVALAVLLIVLPLRRGGLRRALALLLSALIAVGAVGAVVAITGSGSFVEERARYQTYDNERFGAQERGLELAEGNPIGIGPGQFEVRAPISAHSTYIRVLAEQGIAGFFAIVALMFGTLVLALRNVALGRGTFGITSVALLACWCGILANSLFVDTLHWRHLWIVAGLIWAAAFAPAGAVRGSGYASSSAGARTPT
jgi:O-antigen ligase